LKGELYFETFIKRFKNLTYEELIEFFNKEVGNTGWGTARASYLTAFHSEFINHNFDYFEIGNEKELSY
jgi:hypothetical protein